MPDVTPATAVPVPKVHQRVRRWVKNDRVKYRRWIRAFLAWLSGIGTFIVAAGFDTAMSWTLADWGKRLMVAAVFGTVGAINLGDKNPDSK